MSKPKILTLDIETAPALGYHWGLWQQNIAPSQVKEPGRILCFAAKWLGNPEVLFFSEWTHGAKNMLAIAAELIEEADAIVTYNGDGFDLKWFMAEFFANDIPPPPPTTSIDLYKTIKSSMKFLSNKLDFVANYVGIGQKVKHEGFGLWTKVMEGDARAQTRMMRYCKGDVRLTEKLYKKMLPFIKNHPHLGFVPKKECGACGSSHVHVSKWRRTKAMRIQQLHCQTCGSYFDGVRQKV